MQNEAELDNELSEMAFRTAMRGERDLPTTPQTFKRLAVSFPPPAIELPGSPTVAVMQGERVWFEREDFGGRFHTSILNREGKPAYS